VSGGRALSGVQEQSLRDPGQGGKAPPEAESFLALGRATDKSKFVLFAVFSAIHYNKIERYKIRAGTPQ